MQIDPRLIRIGIIRREVEKLTLEEAIAMRVLIRPVVGLMVAINNVECWDVDLECALNQHIRHTPPRPSQELPAV